MARVVRLAYADPPYLGCCRLYDHYHPDERCWDDPATHRLLVERLSDEYPDGWALSLHAPSLATILPFCPDDARVSAWVKTWHQIRPKVPVQFAWEPVILRGGRKRQNTPMVRDWIATPATRMRGTPGAKPDAFCFWIFDQLGAEPDDEFVDLFAGSGGVARAWDGWRAQLPLTILA
jgi:hypothetical protein